MYTEQNYYLKQKLLNILMYYNFSFNLLSTLQNSFHKIYKILIFIIYFKITLVIFSQFIYTKNFNNKLY